ncbi:MAG: DUF4012 domain-containing protein [Atopobiaceae bacterium]|nr:DUF4012 domain-containing protein [Atopobiaceae bacterium]
MLIAIPLILVALLACVGAGGYMLYQSAQVVMKKAQGVASQASTLEHSMLSGNADELRSTANSITADVKDIREEVHGTVWNLGRRAPVIGHDIANVQDFADCAYDLSQNALVPLSDGVAGVSFDALVQERSVNTQMLASVRDSVVSVSPVVVRNIDKLSQITPGSVEQINDLVEQVKEPLEGSRVFFSDVDRTFASLLSILGDGGQTRTYVILAQSNSEIRAGGGYPGQVGLVHVTDGTATLEHFTSVSEVMGIARNNGFTVPIEESERVAFEDSLSVDPAGVTLTPDFVRSGEFVKQFWENAYDYNVDGAIAMDPVFLQRVLGLIGGVTAEDGTVVDGTNAAYELMNNVYWRYTGDDAGRLQDDFFDDVAHLTFSRLLDEMGNFDMDSFAKLWDILQASGDDHRFLAWMADDTNEEFIRDIGLSGALKHDPQHPELGVYANDSTWAKMCWYLDIWADIDEGTRNPDGTMSYKVTAHFKNNFTKKEAKVAPDYIRGANPFKRSESDMMEMICIMAPDGATISDYEVHQDEPIPEDKIITTKPYVSQCVLYGCDTWVSHINIEAGGDTTVTFALNMPAGIDAKPTVRTSPLCHE